MYREQARDIARARPDDPVSAAEVGRFLRAQYLRLLGLAVLGALAGVAISFTQPREWEASTTLQAGQIDEGSPTLVEPLQQASARVGVESFHNQLLRTLQLPLVGDTSGKAELVRQTLYAGAVPGTNLIVMSVRGFSPKEAASTLQAAQNQLIAFHAALVDEARKRMHVNLEEVEADLSKAELAQNNTSANLGAEVRGAGKSDEKAVNALLANMVDAANSSRLQELRERRARISQELGPDHTYNTKPLGEITISRHPVSPKRPAFAAIGGLLGLLAGLFLAGRRRAKPVA